MKQTKTTLIFGVLLAIIIIALVAYEIKTQPEKMEPDKIEESALVPVAKNIGASLVPIVNFARKLISVESGNRSE